MLDVFYPADEMGHHVIDQNGIAKTLLPFINHYKKSIQEYTQIIKSEPRQTSTSSLRRNKF
jgi:hypothetical protein